MPSPWADMFTGTASSYVDGCNLWLKSSSWHVVLRWRPSLYGDPRLLSRRPNWNRNCGVLFSVVTVPGSCNSVAVVYSVILGNSSQNSKRSLQLLNAICTARIYSHYLTSLCTWKRPHAAKLSEASWATIVKIIKALWNLLHTHYIVWFESKFCRWKPRK